MEFFVKGASIVASDTSLIDSWGITPISRNPLLAYDYDKEI